MLTLKKKRIAAFGLGMVALASAGLTARRAFSSDHADTQQIAATPGTDISDVFIFPSPSNPNNVVLAVCVSPLIGPGASRFFDPSVLYQFKIDNSGDNVEDLVIQARFEGDGASQQVRIAGPAAPKMTGTASKLISPYVITGTFGNSFSPTPGMTVFAGKREDPFFFDLERFFTILPDRKTPLDPAALPAGQDPNAPQATTWRAPGVAQDFLKGFNVLSIVVELPKSMIQGSDDGKVALWCTTSK
jgi:hypothetical protein